MATKSLIKSFQKLAISKPELTVIRQHPDYTQLRINVPGNTGQRNIFRALKEATLPRKIGIHGQPRIFHSPRAYRSIPGLPHPSNTAEQKRTRREGE